MAVYRCEVKTINRASGRTAVAAAAYRSGERLRDHQADKTHDYRRRSKGIVHTAILAPEQAPEWATNRGQLWNEAERAENRKNSNTAREVILSLPHELDDEQRAKLVHRFASHLVKRYGVAVDLAVHRPDRQGDNRNHHAHLMMTTRRLTAEGFQEKTRELDDLKQRGPLEIEAIREMWERDQNRALVRAGREERVSRLSNKEQGLDREPEPKIGEAANALMRRGERSWRGDRVAAVRQRNLERGVHTRFNSMRENMARQRAARLARQPSQDFARAQEQQPQQPAPLTYQLDQAREEQIRQEAEQLEEHARQRQPAAPAREVTRAWEQQRQDELRRARQARDLANDNEHDPGRVRERPPPAPRRR